MEICESESDSEPPPIYRLHRRKAMQSIALSNPLYWTRFQDLELRKNLSRHQGVVSI